MNNPFSALINTARFPSTANRHPISNNNPESKSFGQGVSEGESFLKCSYNALFISTSFFGTIG